MDEVRLLRLFGRFLRELLEDENLSKQDLLRLAKALEDMDKTYYGDPQPFRKIKRR